MLDERWVWMQMLVCQCWLRYLGIAVCWTLYVATAVLYLQNCRFSCVYCFSEHGTEGKAAGDDKSIEEQAKENEEEAEATATASGAADFAASRARIGPN